MIKCMKCKNLYDEKSPCPFCRKKKESLLKQLEKYSEKEAPKQKKGK